MGQRSLPRATPSPGPHLMEVRRGRMRRSSFASFRRGSRATRAIRAGPRTEPARGVRPGRVSYIVDMVMLWSNQGYEHLQCTSVVNTTNDKFFVKKKLLT